MWRPFFRGTLPSRLAAAPALTVFCAVLLAPEGAVAQGYPAKPVRILVGVPPGGGTDILARVLARRLADVFGQLGRFRSFSVNSVGFGRTMRGTVAPSIHPLESLPGRVAVGHEFVEAIQTHGNARSVLGNAGHPSAA